jgi:hypothetical protein
VMSCQEKAFAIPVPGGNPFQSRSLVWPSSRVHNIVTNIRLQTALGRVHRAYRKSGIARGEGGKYYGVVYMRSTAERNGDAEATSVLLGRVVSKGTMNDERDSVRNKEYNLL